VELRQLRCVVAVVDHGGFSAAADALGIAQPTLSHAVATLERELSTSLFVRRGRRVTLTAAGEAFVSPARESLRQAEAAAAIAASSGGLESGRLAVALLRTLATPGIAIVGAFRRHHPGVTVELLVDDPGPVDEAIRSGAVDLALTRLDRDVTRLVAHKLFDVRVVAVLPPGSPRRRSVSLDELAAGPIISVPRGSSLRHDFDAAFAHAALRPDVVVETTHLESIVELVLAGAGAAIVSETGVASAVERGAVVTPLSPAVTYPVGVVHRASALTPSGEAFLELARAHRRVSARRGSRK
jgi:DNA-binding transcriptional LysR family regulator